MKIINTMGRPVTVGRTVFPPHPEPMRPLFQEELFTETVGDVAVYRRSFGCALTWEPPEEEGVYYIVSKTIADAHDRRDFLFPREIMHNTGQALSCKSLAGYR